jgi:phosphopantetheinyl transferase
MAIVDISHVSEPPRLPHQMSAPPITEATGPKVDPDWSPGPPHPILEGTEVHLWRVDLGRVPERASAILSGSEHERAAAILSPSRRRRWIAARAALREILGRYLHTSPGALDLAQDKRGKLRLDRDRGPAFSLSHSGQSALCALCGAGAVGADLETRAWTPMLARPALARRLLGAERAEELSRLGEPERAIEFLRAWVLHEARMKCDGAVAWSSDVPVPSPELAALACEHPPWTIRRWELEPVSGAP